MGRTPFAVSGQVSNFGRQAVADQQNIVPVPNVRIVPAFRGATTVLSTTLCGVSGWNLVRPAVLDEIRIEVTSGSAGNAVIGIYDSTPVGAPNSLLATGTVDVTTTGKKAAVFTLPLAAGLYWVGVLASSATATVRGEAASSSGPTTAAPRNVGNWDNNLRSGTYYFSASVAGTMPTNPTWALDVFGAGTATHDVRFL